MKDFHNINLTSLPNLNKETNKQIKNILKYNNSSFFCKDSPKISIGSSRPIQKINLDSPGPGRSEERRVGKECS